MPACCRAVQTNVTSLSLDKNEPSPNTNRGPHTAGRTAMYARRAETGHRSALVRPRKTSTPCLKGSVLLCFSLILTIDGSSCLSTATSSNMRGEEGSKSAAVLTVNSPTLRNPKNPTQHAAQSMTISTSSALQAHSDLIDLRMAGVTGSRARAGGLSTRLMPLKTYWSRGIAPGLNGSPRPAAILRKRTADR